MPAATASPAELLAAALAFALDAGDRDTFEALRGMDPDEFAALADGEDAGEGEDADEDAADSFADWEEGKHARNHGKFAPKGGGSGSGTVDVPAIVGKVVDRAISTTKDVGSSDVVKSLGRAGHWLVKKTRDAYDKLERRYGRAGALAIAASSQAISWGAMLAGPALVGVPLYVPSAVAAAPGAAIAEVVKLLKGSPAPAKEMADGGPAELSPEDVGRLGREFLAEVDGLWGDARGGDGREFAEGLEPAGDPHPQAEALLWALTRAALRGDESALGRLAHLADDPEWAGEVAAHGGADDAGADPATFAAKPPAHAEGVPWQGPSGRWFVLKNKRVVPAKAPGGAGGGKPAGGDPAAGGRPAEPAPKPADAGPAVPPVPAVPKPAAAPPAPKPAAPKKPTAKERAKATAAQKKNQAVADKAAAQAAVTKATTDPAGLTAGELGALAGHLQLLGVPELKAFAKQVKAKVGGTRKELGDRLLAHAGGKVGPPRPAVAPAEPKAAAGPAAPAPAASAGAEPPGKPAPKPAPKKAAARAVAAPKAKPEPGAEVPAGHAVAHDWGHGVVTTRDPKTGELQTRFPAGVPEAAAKKLAPAVVAAMGELKLDPDYSDGLVPLGALAAEVRRQAPGATDADVLAALSHMRAGRQIEGHPLNEVQKLTAPGGGGVSPLGDGTDPAAATLWDRGRAVHYFMLPRGP